MDSSSSSLEYISSLLTLTDVFRSGEQVEFCANGSRGWILDYTDSTRTCTIKRILDNTIERDVDIEDIRLISVYSNSANRSGLNQHTTQLSAASTSNSENLNNEQDTSNNNNAPTSNSTEFQQMKQIITKSFYFCGNHHNSNTHPLYEYLKNGMNKDKGWLRQIIKDNNEADEDSKYLNGKESKVLHTISTMFSAVDPCCGMYTGYRRYINYAFAISDKTAVRHFQRFIENDFEIGRKKRSDEGSSVFNSKRKRDITFTAYNAYKKHRNSQYRESMHRVPEAVYRAEYEKLTEAQIELYKIIAAKEHDRSQHLWEELKNFLLKVKGKISYDTMAAHLGHIVSKNTITNILKNQEGYYIRKDRILPSLSKEAKAKRVQWAHTWWLMIQSIAVVLHTKVVFAIVHMDKKWFYAVVTRTNCKVLTSIGLEPTDYYAHHKNHIEKELYVVCTAFVLNQNDITKGGTAVPIACVRIGNMEEAKKDSFKRKYRSDGTYRYPKNESSKLRTKGEFYFKGCELTGSSEGTLAKPKKSLLKIYRDEIIPALESKVVERFSENGRRKIVIIKQEDNAGLHTDWTYIKQMQKEFDKRDWLIFNQPPQSPITNIHDACIFPMMSKQVSREQALTFSCRLLKGKQLNQTVMKVWNESKNKQAIARAFVAHHQIVSSIIEHKGDNKFLSEKGGLTYGVRRMFVRTEEGDGVIPVTIAPEEERQTAQGTVLKVAAEKGLKYEKPRANELKKARMPEEMQDLLMEHMEFEKMTPELLEAWEKIGEHRDISENRR